jgi:hypothetical protein
MRHVGGIHWKHWNDRVRDRLVDSQERQGVEAGSWYCPDDAYADEGGRFLHTAFATLILESYYRHVPLTASGRRPLVRE